MVWYIAFVAILNLGLGYALAVQLGAGRRRAVSLPACSDASSEEVGETEEQACQTPLPMPDVGVPSISAELQPAVDTLLDGIDPTTGLATRDCIEKRLVDLQAAHAEHPSATIALVEVEQAIQESESIGDRLLRGIADTVRELLTDADSAGRHSNRQFLLLLPHDDLQHATERIEQVRQRVETTHYSADGQEISTTVTCALAQLARDHSLADLHEYLEETLDEANRYGGNRTFIHDGTSPAPVVASELNYAPRTCAI
jgi:GGDEF domain-containing protein